MAEVVAVIPARLPSTRFPEKVIYPYHGKPLLYYIWNEAKKAHQIDRVIIATDSRKIQQVVTSFGGEVLLTSKHHRTGSDRVAEAVRKLGGDIIINIQADNFGLKAAVLNRVITKMKADRQITYATLIYPLTRDSELSDTNIVKVVPAQQTSTALWFSRLPIPYIRDKQKGKLVRQYRYFGHIGVYFFRKAGLQQFSRWKQSASEKAESLEQLRILENGGIIHLFTTKVPIIAVDVPGDVRKLARVYK